MSANFTKKLTNVTLVDQMMMSLMKMPHDKPRMGAVTGPSGFGKTMACSRAAQTFRAVYVHLGKSWTIKHMLERLVTEAGASPHGTIPQLMGQLCAALDYNPRPVIIDESDFLLNFSGGPHYLREIYDTACVPVILIGEEKLLSNLTPYERVKNRIGPMVKMQPASLADARALADCHYPNLQISDQLLDRVRKETGGRAQRIVANLYNIEQQAALEQWEKVDLKTWGARPIHAGPHPIAA